MMVRYIPYQAASELVSRSVTLAGLLASHRRRNIFPPKLENPKPSNPANKVRPRPNSPTLEPSRPKAIDKFTRLSHYPASPSTQPAIEAIHNFQDGELRPFGSIDKMHKAVTILHSPVRREEVLPPPEPSSQPAKHSVTRTVMADLGDTAGSIRSPGDFFRQVGARPRLLPPCLVQEHEGNCPGYQWLEAAARHCLPEQRHREEGGRPLPPIRWQHRSHCARYE